MRMTKSELDILLKDSHAKIRNNVQLSSPNNEQITRDEPKKPYANEAFSSPVIITVHSFRYGGDTDAPIVKWTLDEIVESGILTDDSTKEVSEVRYKTTKIKKPAEEYTVIKLEQCK